MIDKWFIQNIKEQIAKRKRVVVLDPTHSYEFLIKLAKENGYTILRTDENAKKEWQRIKDEMLLRYEAETKYADDNVIFYTTRPKEQLSFIFDYCFTHGCIDFSHPVEWLKKRIFSSTGLQINMDSKLLLTTAKLSVGKNPEWWKKRLQNLEDNFSVNDLLPFLSDPDKYFKEKDKDVRRLFEEKLFELLGQPYTQKPPKTLAKEIVHLIFNKLLNNDINEELLEIYHKWIDSRTYSKSLNKYLNHYKINADINIWNVHPDHCFEEIDVRQLKEISTNFRNRSYVEDKIQKIKKRVKSRYAKQFVPDWANELVTLVEFDTKLLGSCNNLTDVIEFYTKSFCMVDRAIRNLYMYFMNDEEIIRPIQEYYESLNSELLQHWFERIDEYKPNQAGYLAKLLKTAEPGTAVIVGDGVRYEIAEFVAVQLSKDFDVSKEVMLAGIPSETEHNMSELYMGKGVIAKQHKDREKRLRELSGKEISYKNLERINLSEDSDYLVLTYKDIDSAGEKLQLGALKLFKEFENVLIEKIDLLIKKGYKVHLVTDHGFVLTGLLDEADKIEANVVGKAKIHERYIRTTDQQDNANWIAFKEKYGDYNYVYVAKNHRPFKSVGVYGFSHGGLTPQEVIIPNFVFEKKREAVEGLKVTIANKKELAEVVGINFVLKIKAADNSGNLFAISRKVQVILFVDNKQYSESDIREIEAGDTITFEFSLRKNNKIKAILIDSQSKEQLDEVDIIKSSARDLDGLL